MLSDRNILKALQGDTGRSANAKDAQTPPVSLGSAIG